MLTHCLPPPSFWADNFSLSACGEKERKIKENNNMALVKFCLCIQRNNTV